MVRFLPHLGSIRTRKNPNTNTFHAVIEREALEALKRLFEMRKPGFTVILRTLCFRDFCLLSLTLMRYARHFPLMKSPLDIECLNKIWSYKCKWFWSYVNLLVGFLGGFFTKNCLILIKIVAILPFSTFYRILKKTKSLDFDLVTTH